MVDVTKYLWVYFSRRWWWLLFLSLLLAHRFTRVRFGQNDEKVMAALALHEASGSYKSNCNNCLIVTAVLLEKSNRLSLTNECFDVGTRITTFWTSKSVISSVACSRRWTFITVTRVESGSWWRSIACVVNATWKYHRRMSQCCFMKNVFPYWSM